jgi:hypothetical protein
MNLSEKLLKMFEKVVNFKNSLGIKREDMPQIDDSKQGDFLSWLSDQGIKYRSGKIKVADLNPSQKELSYDSSMKILDSGNDKLNKPLIISSNGNYVIDGHHRWYALFLKDSNSFANATIIDMEPKKLIAAMKEFDGVKFKDMNNKVLSEKVLQKYTTDCDYTDKDGDCYVNIDKFRGAPFVQDSEPEEGGENEPV